jgi:hypothetical protein
MILEDESNDMPKDLNTSKNVSSRANGESYGNHMQIIATAKKRQFMLCASCFWCASSYEYKDNISGEKCPVCQNGRIELLSISNDEMYRLGCDVMRGITSEFTSCQMDSRKDNEHN